ncbi:MAG TPA: sialidase family protein [Opitutus sp.]|nr:sialidase family protein [Opitutus sp.]
MPPYYSCIQSLVALATAASIVVSAFAAPTYRKIHPLAGDVFSLIEGIETIEPVVVGTQDPVPGWLGDGQIIVLADGRLMAAFSHENCCRIMFSSDEGRSWTLPEQVPISLTPGAQTHRPAVLQTRDGSLWVFYYALQQRVVDEPGESINPLWGIRTRDLGRTWEPARKIHDGYVGMLQGAIQASGGNIIVPICVYWKVRHYVARCVISTDDGATWRPTEILDVGNPPTDLPLSRHLNRGSIEPSIAELDDGRLLMLIRTVVGSFYESYSPDGGATWSAPSVGALSCGGPGNLVRLPGGSLAFAFNPKNMESAGTKRWGSPIGYDRQSLARRAPSEGEWKLTQDFVLQVPGKERVVHSTITGLRGGRLLITLPGRSTLLVCP